MENSTPFPLLLFYRGQSATGIAFTWNNVCSKKAVSFETLAQRRTDRDTVFWPRALTGSPKHRRRSGATLFETTGSADHGIPPDARDNMTLFR